MHIIGELGRAVPRNGKGKFIGRNPRTIVGDPDQVLASAGGDDFDPSRPGIDGILDEFLHHARGAFDNFTRGDLVDDGLSELFDGH